MKLPIKATLERLPGGLMVVPLLLGATIAKLAPDFPRTFGSFSGALFTGALPILAVYYVCMGASINFNAAPEVLRKGGALLAAKFSTGLLAAFVLSRFIGNEPVAHGFFAGLSTLAVVAAINDTNGGLYMALMTQLGRPKDAAAYAVMCLESGPFLTMVTLGVAGLGAAPVPMMIGAVLPLLLGMALGNLDPEMKSFLGAGAKILIPFFAFALGASLKLDDVWHAGLLGVLLGVCVVVVSGAVLVLTDRLVGGTGLAGIAASSTAGNAVAVPALVAAANPEFQAAAGAATVLVSASVVVTAVLTPLAAAFWAARVDRSARAPA